MKKKYRGIILLITLGITVLLGLLFIGAVWRTQNSIFLSYRTTSEIKSFWSAMAGLELAKNQLDRDLFWQGEDFLPAGGEPKDGYLVTCSNRYVV